MTKPPGLRGLAAQHHSELCRGQLNWHPVHMMYQCDVGTLCYLLSLHAKCFSRQPSHTALRPERAADGGSRSNDAERKRGAAGSGPLVSRSTLRGAHGVVAAAFETLLHRQSRGVQQLEGQLERLVRPGNPRDAATTEVRACERDDDDHTQRSFLLFARPMKNPHGPAPQGAFFLLRLPPAHRC